jgi:hypothetical protein
MNWLKKKLAQLAQVARDDRDRKNSMAGTFEMGLGRLEKMRPLQAQPYYTIAGSPHVRVPYGDEAGARFDPDLRCPGCGAKPGELHVPSCGREQCPACGGTAFLCECRYG